MTTKKRIVILLCVVLLIGVSSLFVDVSSYTGERICGYCGSREEFSDVSYYVFGASWSKETTGALKPSRFLVDFSDHRCEHAWTQFSGKTIPIWDSPLLHHSEPLESFISRSAIVARYDEDVAFRSGVNQILADRTISQKRLLELARFNCLDGGTCQMHTDDPGDAALLALIETPQAEQDGAGQPTTRSESK